MTTKEVVLFLGDTILTQKSQAMHDLLSNVVKIPARPFIFNMAIII